ncbi:sensor domain-containing diguanylate cyclase [Lacimicrobium alkaliphilum]|uniref:diguanylate cyclase n=1 Tax=Lacimicrobium alkaliphilum TaxID=1526571 RepID=A0ABQ1RSB5_9ALTE|nr:diguanylate cyclase [Lacimicrobium alkaliphilum]GGD76433.1 deoxynucleoside kinase [Lacimicrobium alkaliphilum]
MAGLSEKRLDSRWLWLIALTAIVVSCYMSVSMLQTINGTQPQQKIGRGVEYLQDDGGKFTLESLLQGNDLNWQTEQHQLLSYGMQHQPIWFRFTLSHIDFRHKWLLEIDYALLDDLQIWFMQGDNLLSDYSTGDSLPFRSRTIASEKFLFPVPQAEKPVTVYIRAKTSGSLKLPLRLWDMEKYLVHSGEHGLMLGIFFGFLAAMGLSNFFFFLTTRSINFFYYCGYVMFLGLTLLTLHGIGYKYLWPENIWLQGRSVVLFANATMFFAVIFSRELLSVHRYSLLVDKLLKISALVFLGLFLLSLVLPYWLMIKTFILILIVEVLFICGVGIWLWRRGVAIARIYTVAWTTLLLSAMVASLENLNLISIDINSHYLLIAGASVETVLLALVLAISYNQQRQQAFDAQQQALDTERELRESEQQAQEELEYKVQERTLELEITLRELSEKNQELEERNTLDSMTGIRNRRYFDRRYQAEIRRSRREQTTLTIAMIDIDHFKQTNDSLGHLVGDECIRAVARIIKSLLKRPADDVCRYGGEEFALLLPNTDQHGAEVLLEQIRQQIENTPIKTESAEIRLTVSIGFVSAMAGNSPDDNTLLSQADQALYQAKQSGRNKTCQFHQPQE